eukprot:TRINITY_DN1393_c1_g2_i1.p1 TRINITY_DN1393_c1_g2~~TRINITY_DN1393_c1_g2_i1.p1  ORF type:complete len:607 (+),score=112.59 TRINITY_DN1393_c1_g2_i1:151-1821(+)
MQEAVLTQNSILRHVARDHGGYLAKTEDDSFMIIFQDAVSAVRAALAAQQELLCANWPKPLLNHHLSQELRDERTGRVFVRGLRVRMGLNSGDTDSSQNLLTGRLDYFGPTVTGAAKVTALGESNEVLLRRATYRLVKRQRSLLGYPQLIDVSPRKNIRSLFDDEAQDIDDMCRNAYAYRDAALKRYKAHRIYSVVPKDALVASEGGAPGGEANSSNSNSGGNSHSHSHSHSGSGSGSGSTIRDFRGGFRGAQVLSKMITHAHPWLIPYANLLLEKKIGQGSFGEVWRAKWRGNAVAVKRFFRQQGHDAILLELRKESAIMSELRHPNILLFLGACMEIPNLCIVTEYMENGCIGKYLRDKTKSISYLQRLDFASQVARGMDYLHSFRPPLIHRDLSSYNILVDRDMNIKIGDFGLSRIKASNVTMTRCGTAAWTAPEVLEGKEYSEMSDVYSFGVFLWELMMRVKPFKGMESLEISQIVIEGGRLPVKESWPADYRKLLQECWCGQSDRRPSFEKILSSLQDILDSVRMSQPFPPQPVPRTIPMSEYTVSDSALS